MKKPLGHTDRLRAVLAGEIPDRPPVAMWRHWPEDDQSGEALARVTVAFQRRHDFDFVKLCPASNYAVAGWGGRSEWRGSAVGTRDWTGRAVQTPEDWLRLRPQEPRAGLQGELLKALRLVRAELGGGTPVVPTVFNPLAQAKYLAGEETLRRHLAEAPGAVAEGLRTLAESTARFLGEARREGIAGIFLAVQHAGRGGLSAEEYGRFGEPGDRAVLEVVGDCWLNVLHLHGEAPRFGLADDYPVAAVNWHAGETPPTLAGALAQTRRTLCGGLGQHFPLATGTVDEVGAEVRAAWRATGGRRLILAPGCVLPLATPEANITAARAAVECAGAE